MPVDWNEFSHALELSRSGQNLKALAEISRLIESAESDIDRAALVLGQVTCHAHLGDTAKCAELLDLARLYSHEDRLALSQVALSTASLHAQKRDFQIACEQYKRIKSEYHDLLSNPDHNDFAIELDSRLACTLVDAERYSEAVPIFGQLLKHSDLEEKQWLQVFYGFLHFSAPDAQQNHKLSSLRLRKVRIKNYLGWPSTT